MELEILRNLVSHKSITPDGATIMRYCKELLQNWGFNVKTYQHENVTNMYAKLERGSKNFCFAGHVDVVPALGSWTYNPWELTEYGDKLYGRGTNDMKGPLAASLAAIHDYITSDGIPNLSISVALTSDEEIMSKNGMYSLVNELKDEKIDYCILPESCSPKQAGKYIKIGCKGSLNIDLISNAHQQHVADISKNHLHNFINIVNKLVNTHLDDGAEYFEPSRIQLTSIDVGNSVRNIIPEQISAKFNIRFNDLWTQESIQNHISKLIGINNTSTSNTSANEINVKFQSFGYPFICKSEKFITKLQNILEQELNSEIEIGTYGGNSDALALHNITNVVEIGTPLAQAHTVDEYITRSDLKLLRKLYLAILRNF